MEAIRANPGDGVAGEAPRPLGHTTLANEITTFLALVTKGHFFSTNFTTPRDSLLPEGSPFVF